MNTFIYWNASVKMCELKLHICLWTCLTNRIMNNKSKLQNSMYSMIPFVLSLKTHKRMQHIGSAYKHI